LLKCQQFVFIGRVSLRLPFLLLTESIGDFCTSDAGVFFYGITVSCTRLGAFCFSVESTLPTDGKERRHLQIYTGIMESRNLIGGDSLYGGRNQGNEIK
jgi:hypothetical protein